MDVAFLKRPDKHSLLLIQFFILVVVYLLADVDVEVELALAAPPARPAAVYMSVGKVI